MPQQDNFLRRYHDNDSSDVESQTSSAAEADLPHRTSPKMVFDCCRGAWRSCGSYIGFGNWPRPSANILYLNSGSRKSFWLRTLIIVLLVLAFFGILAAIIYISLVAALIHRLNPPPNHSGLQRIVSEWNEPDTNGMYNFTWRDEFSRDIVPKHCHSHNDYWRSVPLYQALSDGCVSVEADVWVTDDNELLVSHAWKATTRERTLRSLYLDPLTNIFNNRNVSAASIASKDTGVFDEDANTSVILLVDFKNDAQKIWPVLLSQLNPLREKNWLTYFDGTQVIPGPLTIVGTGNTSFELIQAMNDRFVFFDAPLTDILNPIYTIENSYYASVQMRTAVGRFRFGKITSSQIDTMKKQIQNANSKGLKSRYWDTPGWPISLRDKIWSTLTDNDVGMLNVDDLTSATRWNWNWCVIAGISLCRNSLKG